MVGELFGAGLGIASAGVSNAMSYGINSMSSYRNFMLSEAAARNADERTRKLYNDLYSPMALTKQYEAAGLSPALMFGGTPGQSGQMGAMGSGAAGPQPQTYGFNAAQDAQLALLKAQKDNIEADTLKKQNEAALTDIRTQLEEMQKDRYKVQFTIATSYVKNDDGSETSLYDFASNFDNFDKYFDAVKNLYEKSGDAEKAKFISTEAGNEDLRAIYLARKQMSTDIAELSSKAVNANFAKAVTQCLSKAGFEEQNATAAVQELKAATENAALTETQKKAWNDMLSKMKDGTTKDLVLILGMMLMQFSGKINYRVNL